MSKTHLLLIIALLFGAWQDRVKIKRLFFSPPPIQLDNKEVVLYSTTWCGYCAKTREYFASNNIPYQDINVETPAGDMAYAQLGLSGHGVPVVVINKDKIIQGYNPEEINWSLGVNN